MKFAGEVMYRKSIEMNRFFMGLWILFFLFTSCHTGSKDPTSVHHDVKISCEYSEYLQFGEYEGFTMAFIRNAWNPIVYSHKFLFVGKEDSLPAKIPADVQVIRTPIERIAVASSTYISFLDKLSADGKIVAVGDLMYIYNRSIRDRAEKGEVSEVYRNGQVKDEALLVADADIFMVSPFKGVSMDRYRNLGVVVVEIPDYLEQHPLGRAEWIRFMGCLVSQEKMADSLFFDIERRYNDLQTLTYNVDYRPTIFNEKPYGGVWYQAGGESYISLLFADAGADYLWSDNHDKGSIPLDFETVYARAAKADFWRIISSDPKFSYDGFKEEDVRFADFSAFQTKHILLCNLSQSPYFEEGVIEPHLILSDLIFAFHPHLLPNYLPKYYKLLP